MKKQIAIAFFSSLIVALGCVSGFAQAPALDAKVQDNVIAALAVKDKRAILGWRFIRPINSIISGIHVSFGGRDLGEQPIIPYPGPNETTSVVALLDIGDPRRADQIERAKLSMLLLRERTQPYHRLAFAVYGLEGNLLTSSDGTPQALIRLLMQVPPLNEPSNLSGALIHAIRTLEAQQTSRRAVFVLTDGHNDGAINVASVRDLAVSTGVVINFLIFPSTRAVDLNVLQDVAAATGGQLVRPEQLTEYLRAPFAALDSGGIQTYSLDGIERFFWQTGSDVRATIALGSRKIELAAKTSDHPPIAGVRRTATYLVQTHPVVLAGSGAAVFALLGGLAFFVSRRRAVPPEDKVADQDTAAPASVSNPVKASNAVLPLPPEPEPALVLAVLQNIGDGNAFSVRSALANIGRATTNEVVIEDPAISRVHAVMEQQGFGSFSIENRSSNGTFVNHQKIDKALLADGDLITMGATTLRYVQAAPAMTPPPQ